MPRAVCHPQVASVGLTKRWPSSVDMPRGKDWLLPFRANGKAQQHDWGLLQVRDGCAERRVAGRPSGRQVTELLPELGVTRTLEGTVEDIAHTPAHPTLQALHETALVTLGRGAYLR